MAQWQADLLEETRPCEMRLELSFLNNETEIIPGTLQKYFN